MTDYGKDITCTDGLRTGRYTTGLRLVGEACYRRLITRRGELLDDSEYGFHLADYLGSIVDDSGAVTAQALVVQELVKDNRVDAAEAEITETDSDGTEKHWTITIRVYTGAGPFRLVMGVSSVTTELVGFEEV